MIIIVCGLPGTGKSYFSRRLSKALGIGLYSTDVVRSKLDLQGAYSDTDKRLVYGALLREMVAEVQKNRSVVLDGTFHKSSTRKRFLRMAATMRQPVLFFEMQASPSTVNERMKSDREYSEADTNVYRKIRNAFDVLEQPHLVLHSDRMDTEEMLDKAKEYINEQTGN